jgi:hypothetical protein
MNTPRIAVASATAGLRADDSDGISQVPDTPILSESEVNRRILLLGMLKDALTDQGVQAVIARHHRLVLSSAEQTWAPRQLTDPSLHIFTEDGTRKASTDRAVYRLDDGAEYSVSDPAAAAAAICGQRTTVTA